MLDKFFTLIPSDPATKRRRALCRVYALLLRLYDEAECKTTDSDVPGRKQESMTEMVSDEVHHDEGYPENHE